MAYAALQDVYRLGLSAQAFVTRPRPLDPRAGDSLTPATGIFRLVAHGLGTDDFVQLVLVGAGAVPTGGSAGVTYSPIPLDFYRFQIALTPNGTPITFSDTGTWTPPAPSAWAVQVDPEARVLAHLAQTASIIDQAIIAHAAPLLLGTTGVYPQVVVGMNARMAARAAVTSLQVENAAFKVATDRLFATEEADNKQLDAWRAGQPILPAPVDQTPQFSDDAPRARGRRPIHFQRRAL